MEAKHPCAARSEGSGDDVSCGEQTSVSLAPLNNAPVLDTTGIGVGQFSLSLSGGQYSVQAESYAGSCFPAAIVTQVPETENCAEILANDPDGTVCVDEDAQLTLSCPVLPP